LPKKAGESSQKYLSKLTKEKCELLFDFFSHEENQTT